MLVFNTINTSRTKENGLNENFRSYFKWGFHNFFRSLIYYNIDANRKESKKNQLSHRGSSTSRTAEANFRKNFRWISTIFIIFICSFPEFHLVLINCNLFRFVNRFSTHFYLFTNRICSFLLAYQSFLLLSTGLSIISRFYSFASDFYSFLLIYQSFLLAYQSFHILVLTQRKNHMQLST